MRIQRQQIISSKHFYRDQFRRLMVVFQINLVLILAVIALLFYFIITRPATTFYATDVLGDLVTLSPQSDTDSAASIAASRYDCIFYGKCTARQRRQARLSGGGVNDR